MLLNHVMEEDQKSTRDSAGATEHQDAEGRPDGAMRNSADATTAPGLIMPDSSRESKKKLPPQVRAALLARAPVVDDPSLQVVFQKESIARPLQRTGMELYNHWGPVDDAAMVPSERMLELSRYRATYYRPRSAGRVGLAGSL